MNPETTPPQTPEKDAQPYDISVGDMLYVRRNLRDQHGNYLRDDEGKIQKQLEDGWEVEDFYTDEATGERMVVMKDPRSVEMVPDPENPSVLIENYKVKPVPEWRLREIQEEAEQVTLEGLEQTASKIERTDEDLALHAEAAGRLVEKEAWLNEVQEDLGEEATPAVVELDVEEAPVAPGRKPLDTGEIAIVVDTAELQFDRREEYAVHELGTLAAKKSIEMDAARGEIRGVINSLAGAGDIAGRLARIRADYDESLVSLGNRPIYDYNPHTVFAQRVEKLRDEISGINTMVLRATRGALPEVSVCIEALEKGVAETRHELVANEQDYAAYVNEIRGNQEDGLQRYNFASKDSHEAKSNVSELAGVVDRAKTQLDTLAGTYDQVKTAMRSIDQELDGLYDDARRGKPLDPGQFDRLRQEILSLASSETTQKIEDENTIMGEAIQSIQEIGKRLLK